MPEKITPPVEHPSLAAALAAFQQDLPKIGKDNTANTGTYSYKYADLSDVSSAVLPAMARHGLSFSTKPTLDDGGRFVLAYTLRHTSGDTDTGVYPLPSSGSPQQVGSAITYARRYVLSAIAGVAPDEDDDGAAAQTASYDYSPPAQQRQRPQQRPAAVPSTPADARAALAARCKAEGWDLAVVAARFQASYDEPLGECTDTARIVRFTDVLGDVPASELGGGAAA